MISNTLSDHAAKSKMQKSRGEQGNDVSPTLTYKINQLKKQIQADRILTVEEKHEKNRKKLETQVSNLLSLAKRNDISIIEDNSFGKMLSRRMESPPLKISSLLQGLGDRDCGDGEEVVLPTTAKLPLIEKIPPYTTWVFLDRNQRMAEDQSVVGRRRIYYEQRGSEALICSDSEEEIAEVEEEKHRFSKVEDRILRMVVQDFDLSDEVLKILIQFVGGTTSEIQERCNLLKEQNEVQDRNLNISEESGSVGGISLDKSLSSALDSFDNLFCRRCLVFDCRLHGCSQSLVYPTEKKPYSSDSEVDRKPCGDQCYLLLQVSGGLPESLAMGSMHGSESESLDPEGPNLASSNPQESVAEYHDESLGKRRESEPMITAFLNSKRVPDGIQVSSSKKLKLSLPDVIDTEGNLSLNHSSTDMSRGDEFARSHKITESSTIRSRENASDDFSCFNLSGNKIEENVRDDEGEGITEVCGSKQESSCQGNSPKSLLRRWDWKPLERELYLKGIEIFGRNSCLIARNLLPGLKTCIEVSSYMNDGGAAMPRRSSVNTRSYFEEYRGTDVDHMDAEMPPRARILRKRGRTRKLKYSSKSAGHPLIWRRIADRNNQSCRQFTPCECQSMCGKDCSCLQNGTCCEKYCGCPKSCKNRFRGCHCAKSQCRSRQCPCFAARRECDPDVCRNCWVSCGDDSLGEPPRQGDGQCGNMRLLLRQQQRILLAKSDVAGWGAFLKNSVNKNDYLGEYTGELISHREADKRGKIYDRANSSYLFDLNDQYVLDAYRKGDKLKFANHSAKPNCYAKVMLVAGDHRVGIFAKERIEANEEIFYDYCYGPDQAPIWAKKPEDSKRDAPLAPQLRARKHQSH